MPNKYSLTTTPLSSEYIIKIWDSLDEFGEYDELLKKIEEITEDDRVILAVGTPGGRCDVGFMLIDHIQNIGCEVNVVVPYPTYSMGAIMALSGDSLKISPGAFLMFHDYSDEGGRSKGNEQFKSTEAYCEIFSYRFNSICRPFLTKKECEDVLQGKDLYIQWNDPTLEARIKRHFK